MSRTSLVFRLNRIVRFFRTPPGLAVLSICWALLLVVVVFVSILLTLWATPLRASSASSTGVLPSVSAWDGWTDRSLFCYPALRYDDWSLPLPAEPSL